MKRLWLPVILLLLAALGVGAFFWKKAADSKTSAEAAKIAAVTDVGGEVKVEKINENMVLDAFIGMLLTRGDRLETGTNSFAALELGKGKEIVISENTKIAISELKELNDKEETWIKMETGAVWANIKEKLSPDSSFEIETPTAVMGVRGTKFSVLHYDDTSIVTVIEGRVEAAVNVESTEPDGTKAVKKIAKMVESLQQLVMNVGVLSEEDLIVKPLTAENLDPFTRDVIRKLIETQPESIGEEIREQLDAIIREASDTATPTPAASPANVMTPAPTITPESTTTPESATPESTMTPDSTTLESSMTPEPATPESTMIPESATPEPTMAHGTTTSGSAIAPVPTRIPASASTEPSGTSTEFPEENVSTAETSEANGNGTDSPDGNGEVPENNTWDQMVFDVPAIIEWDLNANQPYPAGFPDVVPIIADGMILHSETVRNQYTIIVRSMKSFDETHQFYCDNMEDADWFNEFKLANYFEVSGEKEGFNIAIIGIRDQNDPSLIVFQIIYTELT